MPHALLLVAARSPRVNTARTFQELRLIASKRGWQVAREFLTNPNRPHERDAMVDVVRSGVHGSGVIICSSIADLGTTIRTAVLVIEDVLGRGWDICTTEVDTTEPAARFAVASVIANLGELERQGVADRARAALDRARRDGKALGRQRRQVPVDRVRELLAAGRSWRQIEQATGIPSSTLRTAMKREPTPNVARLDFLEAA